VLVYKAQYLVVGVLVPLLVFIGTMKILIRILQIISSYLAEVP